MEEKLYLILERNHLIDEKDKSLTHLTEGMFNLVEEIWNEAQKETKKQLLKRIESQREQFMIEGKCLTEEFGEMVWHGLVSNLRKEIKKLETQNRGMKCPKKNCNNKTSHKFRMCNSCMNKYELRREEEFELDS